MRATVIQCNNQPAGLGAIIVIIINLLRYSCHKTIK